MTKIILTIALFKCFLQFGNAMNESLNQFPNNPQSSANLDAANQKRIAHSSNLLQQWEIWWQEHEKLNHASISSHLCHESDPDCSVGIHLLSDLSDELNKINNIYDPKFSKIATIVLTWKGKTLEEYNAAVEEHKRIKKLKEDEEIRQYIREVKKVLEYGTYQAVIQDELTRYNCPRHLARMKAEAIRKHNLQYLELQKIELKKDEQKMQNEQEQELQDLEIQIEQELLIQELQHESNTDSVQSVLLLKNASVSKFQENTDQIRISEPDNISDGGFMQEDTTQETIVERNRIPHQNEKKKKKDKKQNKADYKTTFTIGNELNTPKRRKNKNENVVPNKETMKIDKTKITQNLSEYQKHILEKEKELISKLQKTKMSWNKLNDASKTENDNWENLQRFLMLEIVLFEDVEPKLSDQIKHISNIEMKSDAECLLKSLKQLQGSVKPIKKNKKANIQAEMKKLVRCEAIEIDKIKFCFAKQQEFWKDACEMEQNVDQLCNFSNEEINVLESLLEKATCVLDSFRAKLVMSKRSRNLLKTSGKLLTNNILQLKKARFEFREMAERIIGSSTNNKIFDLQDLYTECVVRMNIASSTVNEQGLFQAIKACKRFLIEITLFEKKFGIIVGDFGIRKKLFDSDDCMMKTFEDIVIRPPSSIQEDSKIQTTKTNKMDSVCIFSVVTTIWEIGIITTLFHEFNFPYANVEDSAAKAAITALFMSMVPRPPCDKSKVFGIWSCSSKVSTLRFLVYSWGFYFIYKQKNTVEDRPELYFACITGTVATMFYLALEIYKMIAMPTQILRTYLVGQKVESESNAIVSDESNENNAQIRGKNAYGDQETESRPQRVQYFENWKKIAYFLEVLVILFTIPALWSTDIQILFKHNLVFGFLRMGVYYIAVYAFLIDAGANHIDQTVSLLARCARQLPDNYPDSILNRAEPWRKFVRLALLFFAFHQAYPTEFEFDFYHFKIISLFVTIQQSLANVIQQLLANDVAKKSSQMDESHPKDEAPSSNIKQIKKSGKKGKK